MKYLSLFILLIFVSLGGYAQNVTLEVDYGNKPLSHPVPFNGSYEGITISYRTQTIKSKYIEFSGWNSDLTHLHYANDKTTLNSYGAEYGLGVGMGFYVIKSPRLAVNLSPQLGLTYNSWGTDDSHYKYIVQQNALKSVSRLLLQVNYKSLFITLGSQYQNNSFVNDKPYINKFWVGIGIKQ